MEIWHPEAVDHVDGHEPQLDRFVDRDVDLVGHRDVLSRVPRRPPELPTDDLDRHAVGRRGPRERLHRRHARGEGDDQHDERHHDTEAHDPAGGEACRHIGEVLRFAGRVGQVGIGGRAATSAHPREDEQHEDEQVDGDAEEEVDPPQLRDVLGRRPELPRRHRHPRGRSLTTSPATSTCGPEPTRTATSASTDVLDTRRLGRAITGAFDGRETACLPAGTGWPRRSATGRPSTRPKREPPGARPSRTMSGCNSAARPSMTGQQLVVELLDDRGRPEDQPRTRDSRASRFEPRPKAPPRSRLIDAGDGHGESR